MSRKKTAKKLPRLRSEAEEVRFWETHSVADYWDRLEPADQVLLRSPRLVEKVRERSKKKLLSLRLESWQIETAKKIARRKRVPYQRLLRGWITDGLRRASG